VSDLMMAASTCGHHPACANEQTIGDRLMKDVTASAQTMTTDMPPAIRTPDRVETRLGTLNFKDGVPDEATAQKLFDEIDYVHAFEAVMAARGRASAAIWPARAASGR
jgi:hypothetical protein